MDRLLYMSSIIKLADCFIRTDSHSFDIMVELPCTLHCTLLRFSARQHQGLLSLGKRKVATSTVQAVALPLVGKVQPSGSGAGHRLSPPYKLAKAYEDAQKKRPYATQVSSLVVIYACGDFLAQGFERENYDPWRTLRNMIIGGMVAVPSYKWCGSEHAYQC